MTQIQCGVDVRRKVVRQHPDWNGLDYAEVLEDGSGGWILEVFFLGKLPPNLKLTEKNIHITGGRRITDVRATSVEVVCSDDPTVDDKLKIHLNKRGDFSTYKLCIIEPMPEPVGNPAHCNPVEPVPHKALKLDPRYECLEFSFPSECGSDVDCAVCEPCPAEVFAEPNIDYLAKDYGTFRQLMLDRLSLLIPDWRERHVPDVGLALVELLAYVGDHLSYLQDAIATEAYLDTARLRTSVRRHARLIDYAMHEGCNARAFIWLKVSSDVELELNATSFITRINEALEAAGRVLEWSDLRQFGPVSYEVFEALEPQRKVWLCESLNTLHFYTWDGLEQCLHRGATKATLIDPTMIDPTSRPSPDQPRREPPTDRLDPAMTQRNSRQNPPHEPPHEPAQEPPQSEPQVQHCKLKIGDLLIFEETVGPRTGQSGDADPRHRHVVRLTNVISSMDALHQTPLLEIEWNLEDALPFDLCLTSITDAPGCKCIEVSVAHGNVIVVDCGRTLEKDPPVTVPGILVAQCDPCGCGNQTEVIAGKLKMQLEHAPLTFAEPVAAHASASQLLKQDPRKALPAIHVTSAPAASMPSTQNWQPKPDLLSSSPEDAHVVIELNDDGFAHLRFGDGALGMAPQGGHVFTAQGRIGNGPSGNVGANTIAHVIYNNTLEGVSIKAHNPMPATGGTAPESVLEVKLLAPHAARTQPARAITAEDYARLAERLFPNEVSRAAARLRWAGSWQTLLVAIDPKGRSQASPELLERIQEKLERYRRIGHDLHVVPARLVALELELTVCVQAHFQRGHVKAAILERLSARQRRDGSTGFFHPDKLSFGEGVFLSRIVAAVQALPGVDSIKVTTLQRYQEPDETALETGVLALAAFEVAQLDNDPNLPEHGVLRLNMEGGR